MIYHYLIGVGVFALLAAAWVGVQRAWRRSFPDMGGDPDVLAGRPGCGGCVEPENCNRGSESGACKAEEEKP